MNDPIWRIAETIVYLRELFYQFLLSYADVMAFWTSELGQTSTLQHHINTGDANPHPPKYASRSPISARESATTARSNAPGWGSGTINKSVGFSDSLSPEEIWDNPVLDRLLEAQHCYAHGCISPPADRRDTRYPPWLPLFLSLRKMRIRLYLAQGSLPRPGPVSWRHKKSQRMACISTLACYLLL